MHDYIAVRVGSILGGWAVLFGVCVLTMFVNRSRKSKPTPYLAAGGICGVIAALVQADTAPLMWFACYMNWLYLLWRYKNESSSPSTGLSRLNAVWHGLLLLGGIVALVNDEYTVSNVGGWALAGMFSILVGLVWRWIRMVPMFGPK